MPFGIDPILLTVVAYFLATLAVGLWFGRGAGEAVEYTLADRDLRLPVYRGATLHCPSLTASWTKSGGCDGEVV